MPRKGRNSRFATYDVSVFINCPFDDAYRPLFRSLVFVTIYCGFQARCALEIDDASEVRIEKIYRIIEECRFGIHDISHAELDKSTRLPRFNMPLELGLFLGAKRFGDARQRRKACLVLDREPYRYQKFVSDIAGQDVRSHERKENEAIAVARDWFRSSARRSMPGGSEIDRQYRKFKSALPSLCKKVKLEPSEMTFNDHTNFVTEWLEGELAPE
jgi:hypothetical protein